MSLERLQFLIHKNVASKDAATQDCYKCAQNLKVAVEQNYPEWQLVPGLTSDGENRPRVDLIIFLEHPVVRTHLGKVGRLYLRSEGRITTDAFCQGGGWILALSDHFRQQLKITDILKELGMLRCMELKDLEEAVMENFGRGGESPQHRTWERQKRRLLKSMVTEPKIPVK